MEDNMIDEAKYPWADYNFRWLGIKHLPNHWEENFDDSAVPEIWSQNMTVDPEMPGPEPLPRP